MSNRYLITLKPLEPFFFGGEYTFGADDSRNESSRYSATSTEFPQQTALLGMLRKTMLIQNGHLTMHRKGEWVDSLKKGNVNKNYDNAKKLTGADAFVYEKEVDLGAIESISPLFIKDGAEFFIANAKDDTLEIKECKGAISLGKGFQKALTFEGYSAKKGLEQNFISPTRNIKRYSDFFKEVEQVGIKKSYDGETQEDGFFRKKSYYPKNNATFAFIATFTEPITWEKESIVTVGADQSSFKLNIETPTDDFENIFAKTHQAKSISRIVLASETLISQEAYESSLFILGERQPYRQLTNARRGKKSKRYYLLAKGSVLYTEQLKALERELNQAHLKKIGINHYFTIKGTKDV
jgi:CRISPR-associated protein Cmr3